MDRRDSIKAMLISSVGAGALLQSGCTEKDAIDATNAEKPILAGRTPEELERDLEILNAPSVFTPSQMTTLAILCDIILPATPTAGSATDAAVPEFIDVIVRDMPANAVPISGGLLWIERESLERYGAGFAEITEEQRIAIVEDIAWPEDAAPAMQPGVSFFNRLRNLTLTGYYTSREGIKDLGYQGNIPNVWDGVPAEVLAQYDVDYDPAWIAKCVDQSKRGITAAWDDDMNLIT